MGCPQCDNRLHAANDVRVQLSKLRGKMSPQLRALGDALDALDRDKPGIARAIVDQALFFLKKAYDESLD
tara:strand:+ start:1353 stop:1562 length:210 start_codon:yes stop_codon:yes gene_type:complete